MLEGITALLIDFDGVLYVQEERVPGSVDALRRLRDGGLGLRFVTTRATGRSPSSPASASQSPTASSSRRRRSRSGTATSTATSEWRWS
jgi:ribonucleotide monophosphatase NagD (HAD superfamily)